VAGLSFQVKTDFSWPKPGEISGRADGALRGVMGSSAENLIPNLELALKASYIKLGGPVYTGALLSTIGAEVSHKADAMVTWGYLDSRLAATMGAGGRPVSTYVAAIEAGAQPQPIPPSMRIVMWMEFKGLPPEALEAVKRSIAFNEAPPAPPINLIEQFQQDSAYMAVVEVATVNMGEELLGRIISGSAATPYGNRNTATGRFE